MSEDSESTPAETVGAMDRRAAWWSWPVIVLSIGFIAWGVNFLVPTADTDSPETEIVPVASSSDLALLKIQAQIVIASAALDTAAARTALAQLEGQAPDDRSIAAIALLENFVAGEAGPSNRTLDRVSEDSSSEVLELTRKAVSEGVNAEQREVLREYLGWFADLAPVPGLEDSPMGEGIRERALNIFAAGRVILSLVVLGLIVGAILLFVHIHRWMGGVPVNRFDRARIPAGIMLECFALYLGLMVIGEMGATFIHPSLQIVGYGTSVVVPLIWPMIRGVRWRDFRIALGLHKGAGVLREVGAGFVGYLGMLSIASIGIFLTLILTLALALFGGGDGTEIAGDAAGNQAPVTPNTHPIVGWLYEGDFKAKLMCLLLASGFAPLFEEIFFRGAMHRYLRKRLRFFWAALLTSLIFAALHPQGLVGIPALASVGIGLSLVREWRDSLIAPMVAHAINNGLLVGFLWAVL